VEDAAVRFSEAWNSSLLFQPEIQLPIQKEPMRTNHPNLLDEPLIRAAHDNHGHLLLGVTTDGGPKKYIIGIPCAYNPNERQIIRQLGFSQFKCPNNEPPKRG